jgi:hypothetical protein
MGNETNPQRNLQLPADLCDAALTLIQGTRFKSLEELLTFVLQQLTSGEGRKFEAQERKAIEDRLRDLGYL